MAVYYNENDAYCADWLRNLIAAGELPDGEVDECDIRRVQAIDLRGFTQCHFFAGIGGWPLALQIAGWPESRACWTGSCPCQPHSSAARGRNVAPDLWPWFRQLVVECRPPIVFGEQVDEARAWMDRVCDDFEAVGYGVMAAVLPAYGVGLDHARERLYFAGYAHREGESVGALDGEVARVPRPRRDAGSVVRPYGVSPRVAQLRAFGNAIVPEVGAAFVEASIKVGCS